MQMHANLQWIVCYDMRTHLNLPCSNASAVLNIRASVSARHRTEKAHTTLQKSITQAKSVNTLPV